MLLRRRFCAVVVAVIFLFLSLASQTIHRKFFLPPPSAPSTGLARPTWQETVAEPTELQAVLTPAPKSEAKEEPVDSHGFLPQPVDSQSDRRLCGCSKSCISDLRESVWFSKRYDPKQQPILRQKNNYFDRDALKWWLALQQATNDQTLDEVISDMFQVISPPTLDFTHLPSRCQKCAVVGNSGNLRGSKSGILIDSHNFVIRMNKAVTQGHEEDVGNRTTHHFLYPESAVDIKRGVSLVLLPFKLKDLQWLTSALSTGHVKMTYMKVKDRVEADKDKVLVVNPVFFKYVHDYWTEQHGRYPSTGMLAIIFALHMCDQVSVFGYGADKQGNWDHYWEENRYAGAFRKTGVHSAEFETNVIHQLAKEGKIKLYV